MEIPLEIAPLDVKRRLDAGEPIYLIDVREPQEHAIANIEGSELVPMRSLPATLGHLRQRAAEAPLVVFCHHGVRSLNAVAWLRNQGIDNCCSMSGGIDLWSLEIDPRLPRY